MRIAHVNFVASLLVLLAISAGCSRGAPSTPPTQAKNKSHSHDHGEHDHDHAGHDHDHDNHNHDHPGHEEANALELSQQAEDNMRLEVVKVALGTFDKTITLPAMITERPGRTVFRVTAPLTGVVTKIVPLEGEAVQPNQLLFELRLTHEDLVRQQSDLLRSLGELDVIQREVARLEPLVSTGNVPGKTLLERRYEQHKLEAGIQSQRQALLLHGLSEEQVKQIADERQLLKSLEVRAPQPVSSKSDEQFWVVRKVAVEQGQYVDAGTLLCVLADHSELYVEGTAYTQDSPALEQAIKNKQEVAAVIETGDKQPELVEGLRILYSANQVDEQTRVCHFYVPLPNQITSNHETDEGHRFVAWKFKPGQRLKVRVVVDRLPDRIVLPSQAVVEDGVESYVFQRFGDHFDRKPVHVEYRDPYSVVIAQNGGIKPGDVVASSGAAQLQLALKNKSGAGVDPHAGHNH